MIAWHSLAYTLLISRLYYIFENAIKNSSQEKFYEFLIAFFIERLQHIIYREFNKQVQNYEMFL